MMRGIEVSGSYQGQPFVEIGAHYVRHARTGKATTLKRRPNRVPFDRTYPPTLRSSRLMTARVKHRSDKPFFWASSKVDVGVLIYVDTCHTPSCESGGSWSINDEELVKEFASGYDGHLPHIAPLGDPYAGDILQVNESACYKKGLLLLMPGGRLTVVFNAPGTLIAEVAFDGDWPSFRITERVIDPTYEFDRIIRSSVSYRTTGLFYDPLAEQS